VCAALLDQGDIDLGMVPSITYLSRPGDRVVPGVCIGSDGPVASVALFHRVPLRDVRSISLDTSSRTSVVLTQVLCAHRFEISPALAPHAPDLTAMLAKADAALVIGDPALFVDHLALGLHKTDLGAEWTLMTGLPFVWAFWSGRQDAAPPTLVDILQEAARAGMASADAVADAYLSDRVAWQAAGRRYLHENLMFELTPRAVDGLRTFYREAVALGLAAGESVVEFYRGEDIES
jgi:predicted solute-binding protein